MSTIKKQSTNYITSFNEMLTENLRNFTCLELSSLSEIKNNLRFCYKEETDTLVYNII